MDGEAIDQLLEEMAQQQAHKLLACARRIVKGVIADDLLQPQDFPELENHPHFRYEEGVLEGIRSAQMAIRNAQRKGQGT